MDDMDDMDDGPVIREICRQIDERVLAYEKMLKIVFAVSAICFSCLLVVTILI